MQVLFFKSIKAPPAAKGDKPGVDAADVADDKPAHEHLRELADVLQQREEGGGAAEGDALGGYPSEGGEGGEGDAPGGADGAAGGAPGGDGAEGADDAAGGAGEGEFGPDSVSPGDFVAFTAGDFQGSGKVSACGEHGCTVTDKSGRDWPIHWDEVTGNQPAGDAPGADDDGAGDDAGAPAAGAGAPPMKGKK